MKNWNKALVGFLVVLMIGIIVLVSGVANPIEIAKSASQSIFEVNSSNMVTISKEEYERLKRYEGLDEISQIVEQYFYQEPDLDAMIEGAKYGLLAGLQDPYTFYYTPEEYAAMWEDDNGKYAGIGIQISASYETMLCTINRIFNDSPAAQAGLQKGDVLSMVEDIYVSTSNLNEAINIMRGEIGEIVHVQVLRDGELLDFDIPRAQVNVNWVSSCMLNDDVGYILLYEFAGYCADDFHEQLDSLVEQGAKALILDLRDNPGGWIDSAVDLADIFLPEETITYLQYRDGERQYYTATEGQLDIPLVVMMNEHSASSSEILAGALQDYGVATIVGTQSYGKGVVQYVLPIGDDGAGMQLTTAQYFTPSGVCIHKIGITPDVLAEMPEEESATLYDVGDMNDSQLAVAYEIALEKLNGTYVQTTPSQTDDTQADTAASIETENENIAASIIAVS